MQIADEVQDRVSESLNAGHRSASHVALGVAVCVALIGVTAGLSIARPQPVAPGAKPDRHPLMRAVWPSLFSVATLAALRVWNAPSGPARTRALAWWGALQASNMAVTVWRPRDRNAQVVAAVATAALTTVYARAASYVDPKAAALSAPTGFTGLAALAATPPH
ncbi:hypothetical protein [Phenylobacterium immobile]|uniref:hypothetical protein n=1 Tax=Phenylobacterium immobile TaxID=21 RepID=UPI000A910E40|nr:hypothetical protein [Phenylobacterium immobile]